MPPDINVLPDCCYGVVGELPVPDLREIPIRRALGTQDPDVIGFYERLVAAREGLRPFLRAVLVEGNVEWLALLAQVEDLIDRAQQRVESLR